MSQETVDSPVAWARETVVDGWRTLKTIYYASSPSWRFLKAGALVFLGFFLWAGSNLLLSYQPGWTWLTYPMAYGVVVLVYGPVHHVVVIPLALRWRRSGGTRTRIGRHLPNAGLAVFLAVVVVLGTAPAGPVVFDFQSSLGDSAPDINPDLLCTKSTEGTETHVHCHLTDSSGIDHVEVHSGGRTIAVDSDPPFDFDVRASNMTEVTGQRQFQVVLKSEDDTTVRRYTRTLSMIPEG
jgi:hypothetical protein